MGDLLFCVILSLIFDVTFYLYIYINRASTCCVSPGVMYISFCICNELLDAVSVSQVILFLLGVVSAALHEVVPVVVLSDILLPNHQFFLLFFELLLLTQL